MPFSALPDHLNPKINPEAWKGTDDDNFWMRWRIKLKGWFAYGPRATELWAKWREFPIVLTALFGNGESRWEESNGLFAIRSVNKSIFWCYSRTVYLSRIQYWCNWSFQIQWPLFIAFHIKYKGKLLYCYLGAARDADKIYWFPAAFLGTVWK